MGASKRQEIASLPALPYLLVATVACVAFWNAAQCGFVFDDISAIKDNKDIRPHTPIANLFFNDFWGTLMTKVGQFNINNQSMVLPGRNISVALCVTLFNQTG